MKRDDAERLRRKLLQASSFASGLAANLNAAVHMLALSKVDDSPTNEILTDKREPYRQRQPTARFITSHLRRNFGHTFTVTDLIITAREQGLDLLRPSVKNAAERLCKNGIICRDGSGYRAKSGLWCENDL
ncbi:MAG: hypothetical protein GY847_20020 [Proteobacteria bacterium]|nr:hypothetical protein [Pseudomonadota bacterium]